MQTLGIHAGGTEAAAVAAVTREEKLSVGC